MADREPFSQRMDPELYEQVERRSDELGRTKASVFDEMMREWLDREASVLEEIETIKRGQAAILRRLDATENESRARERSERLSEPTPRQDGRDGPMVERLAEYDPGLPEEFTLSKAALREVPRYVDDEGFEIDPAHLDIDRYPKPVRVKQCLPVAVLRYENEETVTREEIHETIKRILGTERYADRYYSNVVAHLQELPRNGNEEYSLTG